ncbi:MAG TPA: hypothetical protein VGR16_11365 [Thermomicrobiales bacterium]|nr:hypothetical protein [Thermomicrobiales bacterium]
MRTESAEERAYRRYLRRIEAQKQRVSELQADLESLKLTLGRFEAEYHARVGGLFVELDHVKLAIDEYGRRVDRLRTNLRMDLIRLEQEIEDTFATRRRSINAEDAETRFYERARQQDTARPRFDEKQADHAKRLYRDLARRYHPDLARTREERERREVMMLRVNRAFHERDLSALQALHRAGEIDDPLFEARALADRVAWAVEEVSRLDTLIVDLGTELATIRASDTHRLWRRCARDPSVLDVLADDLRVQLAAARSRLDETLGTYGELIAKRDAV